MIGTLLEHSSSFSSAWHWLQLLGYFAGISLISIGGAVATAPDMHRHLVLGQQWLSDGQFGTAIAISQAAPGPNVLFVSLLGWYMGLNAAPHWPWVPSWILALACALVCMLGMLLPSCLLTWFATKWLQRNGERLAVRALRWGMAPLVVGLVLASGWVLARSASQAAHSLGPWALVLLTAILVWKTRLHLMWLLLGGAASGVLLGW